MNINKDRSFKKTCLIILGLLSFLPANSQKTDHLVLITLDGVRWQEIFYGVDYHILNKYPFLINKQTIAECYAEDHEASSRQKLLPFLWTSWYKECQILGNRIYNNHCNLKNTSGLSYPGYNEMLTGQVDTDITLNLRTKNPNVTVFEKLNQTEEFKNKIAVFTSWDLFPYILNMERSKLLVNSGQQLLNLNPDDTIVKKLNDQILQLNPRLDYRPDSLTYQIAKNHLLNYKPKILFIAFNDSDEFAHAGRYDLYLHAIHAADSMIGDLCQLLQGIKEYHQNTTIIVTTDHGRGTNPRKSWRNHNGSTPGTDQIWAIRYHPGMTGTGEAKSKNQFYLTEIADLISSSLNNNPLSSQIIRQVK